MSEFNLIWRKYNLKGNPYFIQPLTIGEEVIPLSSFIGRTEEITKLTTLISGGDNRIFVVGDAGVGKTSLVNYVRGKAREGRFFSPQNEIELNTVMTGQEFVTITLNQIYREIQSQQIIISEELMKDLSALDSLMRIPPQDYQEYVGKLNYERLKELFRKTVLEIVHPRFKGLILHYDNLDNIEPAENIPAMFGEIRDLLLTAKVFFIFVGNKFLPEDIGHNQRVRQIFHFPPVELSELSFEDIKLILKKRVAELRVNEILIPEEPHSEEAIKTLFSLYSGNVREILKSLSACCLEIARYNNPTKVSDRLMREILAAKAKKEYLSGLTAVEKEILDTMRAVKKPITPTELAALTKKTVQNISSKYLPKLKIKNTVVLRGKEGRNTYYEIAPEMKWLDLEIKQISNQKDTMPELNKKLLGFF